MDNIENAKRLFFEALQHHKSQRLLEAEELYRRAHLLAPSRISILGNLAAVLAAQRRHLEASEYCEQALSIDPDHFDTKMIFASCLHELGHSQASLHQLEDLIALRPEDPVVHNNLGKVLADLGRNNEALLSYDRSLQLNANQIGVLVNRSNVLAKLARAEEAFQCLKRALALDPESGQAKTSFINLVCNFDFAALGDSEFEKLSIRAISEPWVRPQAMASVLMRLLWEDPDFKYWLGRVEQAWPAQPPLEGFPWLKAGQNRALLALLKHAPVTDISFEKLLSSLRAHLLHDASESPDEPSLERLTLHCALAQQCFTNEYVYDTREDTERQEALSLTARLERALVAQESFPTSWLPAIATYSPLFSLQAAERLLDRSWPDPIVDLLTQQIRQPATEKAILASVSRLTEIKDYVSQEVQQQYEQNPYPRWTASAHLTTPESLDVYLQRRFPRSAYRPRRAGSVLSALNAGCGTGQHPIETARRFTGIQLLAIDLSRTSLAYAIRMAEHAGIENIRFAQADILEIGSLSERFDFIESDGVIHHTRDPALALANLCSLLSQDGVMKLALYSEQARKAVVATRSLIAQVGYESNADGIRSCRREIISLSNERLEKRVLDSADFYTLSECRDLLFHTQEHRFTIPQLMQLLANAGLEFIGFELTQHQISGFRAEFPDEASLYRPEDWHTYEIRHPDVFLGMYQFWVQRITSTND